MAALTETLHALWRRAVLNVQPIVPIATRGHVLITGAPRTGTSALCYWLGQDRRIASFYESRILIAAHKMLDTAERFRNLTENRARILHLVRQLVEAYYAEQRILTRRILLDKEPLEPIAFPDGRYREFLQHVEVILPDVKLLFMTRNPEAIVWSMTRRKWGQSLSNSTVIDRSVEEACAIVRDCTRIISEYAGRKNVYVCRYEALTSNPKEESRRIYGFLGMRPRDSFKPTPSKPVGFSPAELQYVNDAVGFTL